MFKPVPTYAMSTRVLPITFRPELVTLVASPADSPPNRASGPGCSCGGTRIGMLSVFLLRCARQVRRVHPYVLLEVLKRILRSMAEGIQAGGVKMTGRHVVREQSC